MAQMDPDTKIGRLFGGETLQGSVHGKRVFRIIVVRRILLPHFREHAFIDFDSFGNMLEPRPSISTPIEANSVVAKIRILIDDKSVEAFLRKVFESLTMFLLAYISGKLKRPMGPSRIC